MKSQVKVSLKKTQNGTANCDARASARVSRPRANASPIGGAVLRGGENSPVPVGDPAYEMFAEAVAGMIRETLLERAKRSADGLADKRMKEAK